MKKVGILTYHNARNYGAVLQTYALQKTLSTLGYNNEVINYESEYLTNVYKVKKINEIRSLKEFIKWILNKNRLENLNMKFEEFKKNKLSISRVKFSKENIKKSNSFFHSFIVGSDQVWNMNLNGNDKNYLLDFVDNQNKKISYAGSFGYSSIPDQYKLKTVELLNKFNSLSCREYEGIKIISENNIKNPSELVLDPTLLVSNESWLSIKTNIAPKEKYILMYIIAPSTEIIKTAQKLAEIKKCKLICIHNSELRKPGMINVRDCSPTDFLDYIYNAEYVISSSYHGICFSILFNKEFFYSLDKNKENNNSRINTIVSLFKLEDRNIEKFDFEKNIVDIDYNDVNHILEVNREKSKKFLKIALGE